MPNNIHEVEDPTKLYYEPKPEGEKRFWKQHIIKKHTDRNGNGDDVFNATNVKKAEQHVGKEVPGGKPASNAATAAAAKAKKFTGLKEDSQAASSDNPGFGGHAPGPGDSPVTNQSPESNSSNPTKNPIKEILESIAMQAAQIHDELDDDQDLGTDALSTLQNLKDALDQIAESVQSDNMQQGQSAPGGPDQQDTAVPPMKPVKEAKADFYYQEWPNQKPKKAFNLSKYLENSEKRAKRAAKSDQAKKTTSENFSPAEFAKSLNDIRRLKETAEVKFRNGETKMVTVKEALKYLTIRDSYRSASSLTEFHDSISESPENFMDVISESKMTPMSLVHKTLGRNK